jgi:hypothetical protein
VALSGILESAFKSSRISPLVALEFEQTVELIKEKGRMDDFGHALQFVSGEPGCDFVVSLRRVVVTRSVFEILSI